MTGSAGERGRPGGQGREEAGELPRARLRPAEPADAAALLNLKKCLDLETPFMLLEVGEREESAAALASQLAGLARSGNSAVIVADLGGELVGYVELSGGAFRRNRATAHLVIGVLAKASGRGIGGGLLREAKDWAAAHGLHRLELTVMAHNHRALSLYRREGFITEGRRVECLLVNGEFVDELTMASIIG